MLRINTDLLISKKGYLGHKANTINFNLYNYISCIINNIAIIDIEKSIILLKRSLSFLSDISNNQTNFLFISKIAYSTLVSNIKYITYKYSPGIFTNNNNISDIIIITNEEKKMSITKESSLVNIPTISILDTNNSIDNIEYPIISNNDSNDILNMYNLLFIDMIETSIRNNKLSFKYKYIIND